MTEAEKEALTISTASKRNQDSSLSDNTPFLQMVKIYLVHLRRDRREVEMYMPHVITLYNAIQYQKQTLDYLVSSHMARQMFSRFIINSAVTTL